MDYRDPFASSLAGQLDSMTLELFVRQYSDNQNMMDMVNAACRGVLGCDMAQVSALLPAAHHLDLLQQGQLVGRLVRHALWGKVMFYL